jgi:hypothetical protein
MPLQRVIIKGIWHYRFGETGYPYPYKVNNNQSRNEAKAMALRQGRAIEASKTQRK